MKKLLAALVIAALPLAGCASIEPKACSAEWFDYKSEKVLRKFALQNRGLIGDLRQMAKADGEIDPFKALTMLAKAKDFQKFAKSFETVVIPELDAALETCGSNTEFVPAFTKFLRSEGVPESALEWVGPVVGLMQTAREFDKMTPPAAPTPR
jgi:hypothetical protein